MKSFICSYIDGRFILQDKTGFYQACKDLGDFELLVCTPEEAISQRQLNWYKMTVRKLAEQTGDSQDHWEVVLMSKCGTGLLEVEYKKDAFGNVTAKRPSVRNLNKQQMTVFIENILAYAYENDMDIQPPDWNNRYK